MRYNQAKEYEKAPQEYMKDFSGAYERARAACQERSSQAHDGFVVANEQYKYMLFMFDAVSVPAESAFTSSMALAAES